MRLAMYVRVSTDRQAEEGFGLRVQEQQCRRWAKANGHRIAVVFRDEGVSGSNGVEDRVGLGPALEAIRAGKAEGMVVARLDRLARALTVQEAILAKVWSFGGALFAADQGEILRDDPDDPMRTAMRQMAGVFAQLDRGLISKRLRDGRKVKAEGGGYAGGRPPLGCRAEGGALVVDPDESRTVERIKGLRQQGLSLRSIASTLTDEGYTPKKSKRWHPESIKRVLERV